ncbi:hypothetical protein E3N88_13776 [Mikania micrantha]|uniref:FAR1 domain-containing protein n=1 Tax=Mikania micrantha TaxID=192012 RepID=A0A5N6P263_9ASTR|nr:hypothetical protein E3N88_13776 [Mikania micrantha]
MDNSNVEDEDGIEYCHRIGIESVSPNSGKRLYIPDVEDGVKPKFGMIFKTLDDAYIFYTKYAAVGGFAVRKGTEYSDSRGVKKLKYYVCSKEGINKMKKVDTLDESYKQKISRSNSSKRTGCNAHIRLEFTDNKWKIYKFVEEHNHYFVQQQDMHFLTSSRQLTHLQKHMIHSMSKINIGPVKAFNVMRTIFGGFEEVGATKEDCKNFKRELNLFIGEYDAEMAVSFLMKKKEHLPNFSCEYFTDDEDRLKGLFWADEDAKRNYFTFGDVMSFDATYRSNMCFL